MNTKLHAVTDADERPIRFFMTAGQVNDYTGAAALLDSVDVHLQLRRSESSEPDLIQSPVSGSRFGR